MKTADALRALLSAGGRLKYRGSGFGDSLRSSLCRADLIEMRGDTMVLTDAGYVVAEHDLMKEQQKEQREGEE
jgi:hypothetical protein